MCFDDTTHGIILTSSIERQAATIWQDYYALYMLCNHVDRFLITTIFPFSGFTSSIVILIFTGI